MVPATTAVVVCWTLTAHTMKYVILALAFMGTAKMCCAVAQEPEEPRVSTGRP